MSGSYKRPNINILSMNEKETCITSIMRGLQKIPEVNFKEVFFKKSGMHLHHLSVQINLVIL